MFVLCLFVCLLALFCFVLFFFLYVICVCFFFFTLSAHSVLSEGYERCTPALKCTIIT